MQSKDRIDLLLIKIGALVYAASFLLPAYWYPTPLEEGITRAIGAEAFIDASLRSIWPGSLETLVPWLANPIVWLALVLHRRGRRGRAAILGIVALSLALSGVAWLRFSEFVKAWDVHTEIAPYVWAGGIAVMMAGLLRAHLQPARLDGEPE